MVRTWLILILSTWALAATAGQADVLEVDITPQGNNRFSFSVTLRHADTGWDHYANQYEVISPQGKVLAVRHLAHPHIHEQPFTRQLHDVRIPKNFTWVKVRAKDLRHKYGGREVTLSVPHPK